MRLDHMRCRKRDARSNHDGRPFNPAPLVREKVHGQKYAIVVRHIVDGVDAGRIVRDEDARFENEIACLGPCPQKD